MYLLKNKKIKNDFEKLNTHFLIQIFVEQYNIYIFDSRWGTLEFVFFLQSIRFPFYSSFFYDCLKS